MLGSMGKVFGAWERRQDPREAAGSAARGSSCFSPQIVATESVHRKDVSVIYLLKFTLRKCLRLRSNSNRNNDDNTDY